MLNHLVRLRGVLMRRREAGQWSQRLRAAPQAATSWARSAASSAINGRRLHGGEGMADLLLLWGVKDAVDLDDIVVKQALDLDHRSGWIRRLAPQLGLRLVHHGCETVEVTDVNREPYAILQARALRLSNQLDIEEGTKNAGLRVLHQCVGCRIDALHAGDEDEVTGPGAETPGALSLDGTRRIERYDTIWRWRLRQAGT
jgi:hypothetical protein